MHKLLRILLLLVVTLSVERVTAQYYTWGADSPELKWHQIKGEGVKIIYPDTATTFAWRTLQCIEAVRPYIGYGFRYPAMKIPFVMHPENLQSNGLVMWLPKRVEFLTSPSIESYAMPWYKQLVAHEYRHAVQYNNLNRGVIRALSYVLGQQGSTVGLLFLPIWLMEGDAVQCETQMATFGRALQPSFTMELRAIGSEITHRRNSDKWFCGSYLDYIPDHYRLGYQIAAYSYDYFGENIWNQVAYYSTRNPYVICTTSVALGKYYDTNVNQLFHRTFNYLNNFWSSLPENKPSATPINSLPKRNHTIYSSPIAINDSTVVAIKQALNRPARFVSVDINSGKERKLPYVGDISTRPAYQYGRIWWTEYRRSLLFEQRVRSQLCYMDLGEGRTRSYNTKDNVLYPTPMDNQGLAWVEYRPNGEYIIAQKFNDKATKRYSAPWMSELHGLAWDNITQKLYTIITDQEGMHIAELTPEGEFRAITRSSYTTLSDLRAKDGKLYFGSIASGYDEAHSLDLATGKEYRQTTSRYGGFDPVPIGDSTIIVTDYTRLGYRLAQQKYNEQNPVEWTKVPQNVVNPSRLQWDVPKLDTVGYQKEDSVRLNQNYAPKRYRKGSHLFNVHSWMPVSLNPFNLVDEHNVAINWGATIMSQNLLSSTEAFASWGYNHSEGSLLEAGIRYSGLGVLLSASAAYGGKQNIYSLAQYNPETGDAEYQKTPSPDTYFSVSASATLPLYFQRGYHNRILSLGVGWGYSNGVVANLGQIRFDEITGTITNIDKIGYTEGLHKLNFMIGYSDMVRMAYREFAPRWGYSVTLDYAINPSMDYFSDLISFYGKAYIPGFVRPHSIQLALSYQTSFGGTETPKGTPILTYKSSRLLPHSYSSSAIQSNNYVATSLAYQLPVWYPEGGITSVIYFKRIRLNLGADYAQFLYQDKWHKLYAYGGDIMIDMNIFRQPDSATSTLTISLWKPKSSGLWVGAGIGLPF